jgi:hypothetical protein
MDIMNKKIIAGGIAAFSMAFLPAAIAVAAPSNAAAPNGDSVTITNNHANTLLEYNTAEKANDPDHIVTGAMPINGNTAGFTIKDGQDTKAASEYFKVVDPSSKDTVAVVNLSMKRTSDGALSVGVECGGAQCSWSQDSGTGNWSVDIA